MRLVFTKYLDRGPSDIEERLDAAIPAGLAAAAERIDASANPMDVVRGADTAGVVLRGDDLLDGTEINWEGDAALTTVRVAVPWKESDRATGKKLLAATRFAQVFSTEARLAA